MDSFDLLRMLASLAATLGLMLLLAWGDKRFGGDLNLPQGNRPQPRLRVAESRRLSPTTTLYLVQHDATEHLLSVTNGQTTVISSTAVAKPAKVKA